MRVPTFVLAAAFAAFAAWMWSSYCPQSSARGKIVLITGVSSGIGVDLATQYGAEGAHLILAARRKALLDQTAAKALQAGAASVLAIPTDMTKRDQVEALIRAAKEKHGGLLDVLLLNHATVDDAMVVEYNSTAELAAAIEPVFEANVLGSIYAAHAAMPMLERSKGHIAVVSSASTIAPAPFHPAYVSSKRALGGFFDTLRHELHLINSNVTVQIQILGMIATEAVTKDPGQWLAIPVEQAAREMICAVRGRWDTIYVPHWYSPLVMALNMLGKKLGEITINYSYVFNVQRYLIRIADAGARIAADALAG